MIECSFEPRYLIPMAVAETTNTLRRSSTGARHANLRRLFVLRNLAIAGQITAFAVAAAYFDMDLPYQMAAGVILAMSVFNFWTFLRLQKSRPVSDLTLMAQLVVDVTQLSTLLYLTGGATNPFAGLFLLPVTISATILPARYTWSLAGITVASYSLLVFFNLPLPHAHGEGDQFQLHVTGMWLGFLLSAGFVAYFVVGMGTAMRRQERALAQERERALRNERLLALGTQAATTAHELGTPLTTISLLVDELAAETDLDNDEMGTRLKTLKGQVDRCKNALAVLSASAGNEQATAGRAMTAPEFIDQWLSVWQAHHPELELRVVRGNFAQRASLLADRMLLQALDNILDNAVEASPNEVEVSVTCDEQQLMIEVRDRGPGLPNEARKRAGKEPFTERDGGMGLGLFLSHAIIERFGGVVTLFDRNGGGVTARIAIPLQ